GDLFVGRLRHFRHPLKHRDHRAGQPRLHVRGDWHRGPGGPQVFDARGLGRTGRDLLLIGLSYAMHTQGTHVLLLVVAAIAFYGCTLAPVTWVVLSEIFPNRVRGTAMALAVFALWVGCFTLTYSFPLLNQAFGPAGTFWIYAAICALGSVFIFLRLPETKGKTLEEIEGLLKAQPAS